ncbi:TipAS antibiotic-recognition domain-containing protein [Microbacterium sp. C7(2022)]|uniref:MerR family transcriptional regulator n=1 Tax=Microbacterium sp. C7(2022) TaxID=2992759 RepID=UPI00237BFBA2|nr:TipAS antibiotic-recognition domain-containing protein [Microbacterium sp. C7(2022)]MDE0545108.1 TipAS antibiotic-recognition domain-containing protein [Microbacterium sp. C7(2022)]
MDTTTLPEWSIQQVAKMAGTTSRTLRHYDDVGILTPSRIGHNGYRYYDERALRRLQRILLLRDLGLGLPQIADALAGRDPEGNAHAGSPTAAESHALRSHLTWLREEQNRLARQIASVQHTIDALEGGEKLMADKMFDGFDHTQYKDEVEQRWGERAYADSDAWWRAKSPAEQKAWQQDVAQLSADWVRAAESGAAADSDVAQALAQRHVEWLRSVPGTPAANPGGDVKAYVLGLADMYVADERFGANYATADGGSAGAEFVREALQVYAAAHL